MTMGEIIHQKMILVMGVWKKTGRSYFNKRNDILMYLGHTSLNSHSYI
jgi:hypothetical protein